MMRPADRAADEVVQTALKYMGSKERFGLFEQP